PSCFSTCAIARFRRDAGIVTSAWPTSCAFLMRVSMSAIGSCMLIRSPLPARLDDAGHFAAQREIAQLVPAEAELAIDAARSAGERAAVANAHRRGVARQLLQLGARLFPCLIRRASVVDDVEQRRAPRLELLDGFAAFLISQLDGELSHALLPPAGTGSGTPRGARAPRRPSSPWC